MSSRKAARRARVQCSGFEIFLPLFPDFFPLSIHSVEEAPMHQAPGIRRMDEWLVSGSVLGKEKESVLHQNANLSGLDDQGLQFCLTQEKAEAGGLQV